jgi:NTE family protein
MEKCTAFVFGGGGSHGALQVGALRAFMEAGISPDLLVGTSIGAVNAAGIAIWGYDLQGLKKLEQSWERVSEAQVLDGRISELILRAYLGRPSDRARKKAIEFFTSLGLSREMKFGMIEGVRLGIVSADIESGQPIIYRQDPEECILESLLMSVAVPPWFPPFSREGRILMDGGALSNVPIEPALRMGATEIFAFDLNDCMRGKASDLSFTQYLSKYFQAISQRTEELEATCAELRGVPVHRLTFTGLATTSIHDFSERQVLIEAGYTRAKQQLEEWQRASS